MHRSYKASNKNSQTKWDKYELLESEPKQPRNYRITPELEDELIDHSRFLKKRVWRQMKTIRKRTARPRYAAHYVKPQKKSNIHFRNKIAHIV